MKAQAQQVIRVVVDQESIDRLQDGAERIVFPLNEERSRVLELEYADEFDQGEEDEREERLTPEFQ